jgi:hypothetical protein
MGRWDSSEKWFGCKIHNSYEIVTAYARNTQIEGTSFNIPDFAEKALGGSGTLKQRIAAFDVRVAEGLADALQQLKAADPVFFKERAEGRSVSDVVFLGFEDGQPKMFLRWFMVSVKNDRVAIETRAKDCPGNCTTGTAVDRLGHHETIDRELEANPTIWNRGFAEAIEYLIRRESEGEPAEVGGPIAILEIDQTGRHWIRYGSCKP